MDQCIACKKEISAIIFECHQGRCSNCDTKLEELRKARNLITEEDDDDVTNWNESNTDKFEEIMQ